MTTTPCCERCRATRIVTERKLTAGGGYPISYCSKVGCECHTSPTQEEEEWEKKMWVWASEFFPGQHSDKFEGLIALIRETRLRAFKEGYETAKKVLDEDDIDQMSYEQGRQSVLTELLENEELQEIKVVPNHNASERYEIEMQNGITERLRQIITNRLTKEK